MVVEGMLWNMLKTAHSVPVKGTGWKQKTPLHPIPTERPFQLVGVDIMELPVTTRGNKYVVVFQDSLTKWPMVYPTSDQKAERIIKIPIGGRNCSILWCTRSIPFWQGDEFTIPPYEGCLQAIGDWEAEYNSSSPGMWWCSGKVQTKSEDNASKTSSKIRNPMGPVYSWGYWNTLHSSMGKTFLPIKGLPDVITDL